LLVVIAIIALLLSILLPALTSVKDKAKAVVCVSNLRQWDIILKFFANDHEDKFPDADMDDDGHNEPRGQWWFLPLRPYYIKQPDILICPKAQIKQDINSSAAWVGDGRYPPIPSTPSNQSKRDECWGRRIIKSGHPDQGKWMWSSYAPNGWIMDPKDGTWGSPIADRTFYWGKFNDIPQPSRVPIFLDCRHVDSWPHHTDEPDSAELANDGKGWMGAFTLLRHGKAINGVFGDSSGRKILLKELWKLKWHRGFNTSNYYSDEANLPGWMR